jgi:hypothetical protein
MYNGWDEYDVKRIDRLFADEDVNLDTVFEMISDYMESSKKTKIGSR